MKKFFLLNYFEFFIRRDDGWRQASIYRHLFIYWEKRAVLWVADAYRGGNTELGLPDWSGSVRSFDPQLVVLLQPSKLFSLLS